MRYNSTSLAYRVDEHSGFEEVVTEAQKNGKKKKKPVFFMFICTVYVISIIASLLIKTAYITEQRTKLTAIREEYNQTLNENKKLEVSINSQIDLRKVEEIAIATLNMNKPKKSQTVYVSTKPNDYGEVISYNNEEKAKTSLISGIIKSFTGIFAYSN